MIDDSPPQPARRWYDFCHLSVNLYFSVFHSYRVLTGWRMPATGPVLILANHASFLDPPVIGGALPRHIFYLARRTLFRNAMFRRLIRSVNAIPVDQENNGVGGLKASVEVLRLGEPLLVFPEGTRSPSGEMGPFMPGVHLILKKCPEAMVLPVGVSGAHEALSMGRKLPTFSPMFLPPRKGALCVSVGRPLPGSVLAAMPRQDAVERMTGMVRAELERARAVNRSRSAV
ncbi:MAG: lysophospholipid acyltransferase family protein [Planctomycetota bacterium]|nr:1-acyl-sn-glycerol-3-phosphate acyltransferase [Planctomycetota bacterium]